MKRPTTPKTIRLLLSAGVGLLLTAGGAHAQFAVTSSNAVDGDYPTFADAITALTTEPQTGFQPELTLGADITVAITIPAHDWDSLFIRPSGQRVISFSVNSTSIATVLLDGATNVVIDGIDADHDASDRLIINNSNTGTSANTIRFVNGASGNTVKNCTVRGGTAANSTTQTGAVILFWTASATAGNSNNTIANCRIRNANTNPAVFDATTLLPSRAIYSFPSTTAANVLARNNTGNRILNNWIFNYFLPTSTSQGIFLNQGNHQWTIAGNRFFQEAARVVSTSGSAHRMIDVNQAGTTALSGGHVIQNNILGYAASDGTGVYQVTGTVNIVRAIYFDVLNTGPRSTISGNVINGIAHTSSASGVDAIQFILINSGQVDADDNEIGNVDGDAATITTNGFVTPGTTGILNLTGQDLRTRNNRIGGITTGAGGLVGIRNAGSGTWECTDNVIGGNFGLRITAVQSGPILAGIQAQGTTLATIENNTVRNLRASGNTSNNTPNVRGIEITSSNTAEHTISNNTIENIIGDKPVASGNYTVTNYGIYSSRRVAIENNTIRNIVAEGTSTGIMTSRVRAIWVVGASSHLTARNNTIEGVRANFPNATTALGLISQVEGIRAQGSSMNVDIRNNRIAALSINGLLVADTATSSALAGIHIIGGNTSTTAIVDSNLVYGLENTGTQNFIVYATGIRMASAGTNTISRNTVHSIRASRGTGTTALTSTPTGIWVAAGATNTLENNMVRIGVDPNGTQEERGYRARGIWANTGTGTFNLQHNSVYVGGAGENTSTQSSHALFCEGTTTRNIRNNILWNARDLPGTHYAMQLPSSAASQTSDHNCLQVTGTQGTRNLVRVSTTDYSDLAAWQVIGKDANSISVDAPFLDATGDTANVDLHLDSTDPDAALFNGAGVTIAGITQDIDTDLRQSPPDIGADEICLPIAGIITADPAELCAGEASDLTLSGQSTGSEYSYLWRASTTAGGPHDEELGTGTTQGTGPLTETTYYVADVTCSLAPGPTVVTVTTPEVEVTVFPLPTGALSGGGEVCSIDPLPSVTFTFTGTAPYDFAYTIDGGTPIEVEAHPTDVFTITNAGAGVYALTALSDVNCTGTDLGSTVQVTVIPADTWYADADGDGFGDPNVSMLACDQPLGYVANNTDCNDGNDAVFPGAVEVCDGIDNNCNDLVDDNDPGVTGQSTWYADADGDGFGNPSVSQLACTQPSGYVANNTDCNDGDEAAFPGAACTNGDPCIVGETLDANCNCTGGTSIATTNTTTVTECTSYTWAVNGETYTTAGTYTVVNGCTTEVLNLTLTGPTIFGTSSPTVCGTEYVWNFNGETYTESGTYVAVIGCVQTTLNLTLITPFSACDDGNPNTVNDTYDAECNCVGQVLDCNGVPNGPAVPGSACDDGNPTTINDTWSAGCVCQGTPSGGNATQLVLELRSNNGAEVSWEILNASNTVVCSGDNYPVIANIITDFCELLDGCYRLRVFDSQGDGFGVGGGYQLRLEGSYPQGTPLASNVLRIIDNLGNFTSGSLSAIANGPNAFCLPMSSQVPIFASRDKLDWTTGSYIVSEEDADVSGQWQVGDQTDDGYEFWFFDPNGTYSFRRFRNHATNDGFANVGATRACHARVNGWLASNHIPANRLMNVRIRARVNGTNKAWGPAFRFMIDPVRALCPLTKLMDDPNNPFLSCNQTRNWGSNNYIHARPVSGANRYQFRFRTGEGFNRVITSTNYFLQLNWATQPLVPGATYDVDVRISKDGGVTWCVSGASWGESCKLTIAASNGQGNGDNLAMPTTEVALTLYPNPNNGQLVTLTLSDVPADADRIVVEFFDLAGKLLHREQHASQGHSFITVTQANGTLAPGVYLVQVRMGEQQITQRLVIAP